MYMGENITGAYKLGRGYNPMTEAMRNFMNSHGHKVKVDPIVKTKFLIKIK